MLPKIPANTWPPMKKPIEKFMNAAEIPPSGPRIKIAIHPSRTWYAVESIGGSRRRRAEGRSKADILKKRPDSSGAHGIVSVSEFPSMATRVSFFQAAAISSGTLSLANKRSKTNVATPGSL